MAGKKRTAPKAEAVESVEVETVEVVDTVKKTDTIKDPCKGCIGLKKSRAAFCLSCVNYKK